MSTYARIKGGEKNLNSGIKWTREEIIQVYFLYKKLNGVGLHEHNPAIQELATTLGRTVRSTEAQTLMFRNLERSGDYSHGNMNKISTAIWNEFELQKEQKSNYSPTTQNQEEADLQTEDKETKPLKYEEWNKLLVYHYFNEDFENTEIDCLPVSSDIFQEITNYEFEYDDFIQALKKDISSRKFFNQFSTHYKNSIPHNINGRNIRKPIPDFLGYLIFLIHALTESEGDCFKANNVYDRINKYGKEILGKNWENINSGISRDLLEPVWAFVEEWSYQYLKGKIGYVLRKEPKNNNRKYVTRLERHAIFNSNQFSAIIDNLISDGYRPESTLSKQDWVNFFTKHIENILKAKTILEYISDGSSLENSILGYLNAYLKQHFTNDSISSENGNYRTPATKLKICIKQLPEIWDDPTIDDVYFKASGNELQKDTFIYDGIEKHIEPDVNNLSKPIAITAINLDKVYIFQGENNRYATGNRIFWLTKNHDTNEWIEVDRPTNSNMFILIAKPEDMAENGVDGIERESYIISTTNYKAYVYRELNDSNFEKVYKLYNPYEKVEGKIELLTEFATDRRSILFKDLNPKFRYIGKLIDPVLIILSDENKELCELSVSDENGEKTYVIPNEFSYEKEFRVSVKNQTVKTRNSYRFGDLEVNPINVQSPGLKDHEGIKLSNFEVSDTDIIDIPGSLNRKVNVLDFNSWNQSLYPLFKGQSSVTKKVTSSNKIKSLDRTGDKLLSYLALDKSTLTYDFPKLVKELEPSITNSYAKRIMIYWRDLGYLNFQDFGESIKVNPTTILFLQSEIGIKGYLTGYRNKFLVEKLRKECDRLHIKMDCGFHADYMKDLYPTRVILYDEKGRLDKFLQIKNNLNIEIFNEIQNPYNTRYAVYQLACFYTQRSVHEFSETLAEKDLYNTDHHRKSIYQPNSFSWKESNERVENIENGSIVRYDGFSDRSITHIIRHNYSNRIVRDLNLALFSAIGDDALKIKENYEHANNYDLYVPFYLGLPFWIEKGLVLLNGQIPDLETVERNNYRVYRNINKKIIDVLRNKLNQKLNLL